MTEEPLDTPRAGLIAGQGRGLMLAVLAICGVLILAIIIFLSILAAEHSGDLQRLVTRLMTPSPSSSPPSSPAPAVIPVAPPAGSEPPVIFTVPPPPPVEARSPAATPAMLNGNIGDWFPANSYPPEARGRNEQGRVVISLRIDPSGRPRKCQLVSSSGSGSLDAATCRLALRNGRFIAARGVDGEPVWGDYRMRPVKWQIED
ncbi:energy transducer TonB [Sphingomonas sp.]|uniref:energy transducer TonB n=1 Tax=Sphingomonas sp. TaxID=28214 RepID=UPI003D6D3EE8